MKITSSTRQMLIESALLGLFASVQAEIGGTKWAENAYQYTPTGTNKIGVSAGVPYSNDSDIQAMIDAAMPLDGDLSSSYTTKANVVRIKGIISETYFDDTLFPKHTSSYTYDGFLEAAAKFEKFCGTDHGWDSDDVACKRELATLFAHFA